MFSTVSVFENGERCVSDLCIVYSKVECDDAKHAAELVAMIRDDYQDQNKIALTLAGRETVAERVAVRWTDRPIAPERFDWDSPLSEYEIAVRELEY